MTSSKPAVSDRRIRATLKATRESQELSFDAASAALGWNVAKLIRIERGVRPPTERELRQLLRLYRLKNSEFRSLVRSSELEPSKTWNIHGESFDHASRQYFELECRASGIRQYEPTLVPGLLQTPDYTREILSEIYMFSKTLVRQHVEARLERQSIFDQDEPPIMRFLVDEAVILRLDVSRVGRRQLGVLKMLEQRPRVSLGVIPLGVPSYRGLRGPFIHLEFGDNPDDALYLESVRGDESRTYPDDPQLATRYLRDFLDLESAAQRLS